MPSASSRRRRPMLVRKRDGERVASGAITKREGPREHERRDGRYEADPGNCGKADADERGGGKHHHEIEWAKLAHFRRRPARLAVEHHHQQRQRHQRDGEQGKAAKGEAVANAFVRPAGKPDRCGEANHNHHQANGQRAVRQPEHICMAVGPVVAGHRHGTTVPLAFGVDLMVTAPVCGPHVFLQMPSLAEPTPSFYSTKGLPSAAAFSTIDCQNSCITTSKNSRVA